VLIPVRPFGHVGRAELPLLARLVEAGEEAPLLLLLETSRKSFTILVPVQVALERVDVLAQRLAAQRRQAVGARASPGPGEMAAPVSRTALPGGAPELTHWGW
jgi:hypothetical protein